MRLKLFRGDSGHPEYRRFLKLLALRQRAELPETVTDFRTRLLSRRMAHHRIGFKRSNLNTGFSRNMEQLFPNLVAVNEEGIDDDHPVLMYGAILDSEAKSHASAMQLMPHLRSDADVVFFEMGFLASATSWSESLAARDPAMACLGYVYDDRAQFFMADYPNRLTERLNGMTEISDTERDRARRTIDRIVAARISKYNSQPFFRPKVSLDHKRRVLVVDQNHSDASTFYGRAAPNDFAAMLDAAIAENPDAEILVKTHPDLNWTKSGRRGYFDHLQSSGRIRLIRENLNPFQLFDLVDTVYVGTSGMGLEALLAGKRVVCFGAPFYAGWGVTDDRREIPHRGRTRDLLEIFHFFYIWYTIYNVPGIDGPAEIEDVLDFIQENRPVTPIPAEAPATPTVSIVIPVHGVEDYISDCLASIQRQIFQDFEVIAIDDVSPDSSADIVAAYAESDPRITLIRRQENVGPGFVRNQGIEAARGRYVLFIDPDDYMPNPSHLGRIVAMAEEDQADMVRFRKRHEQIENAAGAFVKLRPDHTESAFKEEKHSVRIRDYPEIAHSRHFWNWLYRREFLDRNAVRFRTAYREERAFLVQAYMADPLFSVCDSDGVVYRVRDTSAVRRKQTMADVRDQINNFEIVVHLLKEKGAFDEGSSLSWYARFQVSQFLHYLFFGFAYKTASAESEQAAFVRHLAAILAEADVTAQDLVSDPMQLSRPHVRASAYGLLLASVRAQRLDFIETALQLDPVRADDLWQEFLEEPANDAQRHFQVALGIYARNKAVLPAPPTRTSGRHRPRILLHLGSSKTGSTSLQHRMDHDRAQLLRGGVWYPEVGQFWQADRPHKQGGHAQFLAAAATGDRTLRNHIDAGVAFWGERLHTIVLSSEGFFLDDRAFDLPAYFDGYDVEVIVYLRRQDAWANSQYCEFVAGGTVSRVGADVTDWLAQTRTRTWLDYAGFVSRWVDLLGKDAVTVRVYSRTVFIGGDLIHDFAQAATLPQILDCAPVDARLTNSARLSAAHVELIRTYNSRWFADNTAYLRFIETAGEALMAWRREQDLPMPRPWILSDAQAADILAAADKGNRWIAREFLDSGGALFPEETVSVESAPLYPQEIRIVHEAYHKTKKTKKTKGSASSVEQLSVADYGMFGWRRWALPPAARLAYRFRTGQKLPHEFNTDPATFVRKTWGTTRPWAVALFEPQALKHQQGLLQRACIRVLRPMAHRRGGTEYVRLLENEPVYFARSIRNPAIRTVLRIVFPSGELIQ
ncbi:hypothetical protein OCH239_10165 [Roseivivax halodurans JCM 10272]|uniref:Glycosyltransferase 2-like domain-containing protein n=1 Tax=Roseivivax halodurans JCM 10272 TaxID=1449350 RepID=X7EE54_9RHOB|nr:glycosyltransferase [Roseivivax halodurans]ETX13471.1 hypothetical protein OCH239_10165 [Roseivivax halodurans JCM 10272]